MGSASRPAAAGGADTVTTADREDAAADFEPERKDCG